MVTIKTTEIRYALANDAERLYEFLDTLTMKHDFVSVTSIGKTAEGKMIPVVTLGTGEKGNVYVGGMRAVDLISPSVLLRFICDYAEFYLSGKRMYGINMQYLWEHRTIHVIPMLNPDGYTIRRKGVDKCIMCDRLKNLNVRDGHAPNDFSEWRYNACGKDIALSFDDAKSGSVPEADALENYINYYADTLDAVLDIGADCGIVYSSGRNIPLRAKTVARLFSRMSGYQLDQSSEACGRLTDYVIEKLGKNAYHIGCLDEGECLPESGEDYIKAYAALREALFSCPLL